MLAMLAAVSRSRTIEISRQHSSHCFLLSLNATVTANSVEVMSYKCCVFETSDKVPVYF